MRHRFSALRDRHEATGDAKPVPEFRERGVGLVADQGEQPRVRGGVEFGSRTTRVGFGIDGPRAAFALEEPDEERQADGEQVGELAERVVAAIDGRHDAFPKVVGIGAGTAGSPSRAYPEVFYSVCDPCVNRSRPKKCLP